MRIGQGIDLHEFSSDPDRPLILGGTKIAGARGLQGHSDADVIAHALADAILGGASLGDLGTHFPDSDPKWKGEKSTSILTQVVAMARVAGFETINADCTVIAQTPLLSDYIPTMVKRMAEILGAPVSVKATRAEGIGALGRSEGIACMAMVLLDEISSAVSSSEGRK